jgi:hypothetical protein
MAMSWLSAQVTGTSRLLAPHRCSRDPDVTQSPEALVSTCAVGTDEDGTVLYRLFHQAFDDQLISHPADPEQPVPGRVDLPAAPAQPIHSATATSG